MYIIGLTGGIASGKSTVANLFAQHGVAIIDADVIARAVILPEESAYQAIVAHFGHGILRKDGHIDRKELGQIVFNDPKERLWLEKLLHPLIREQMKMESRKVTTPYCIEVIPLLVETLPYPEINRILVVDVSTETQKRRFQERDHLDKAMINQIVQAQIPREERLAHADDVLVNEGNLSALTESVERLHEKYLQLAAMN